MVAVNQQSSYTNKYICIKADRNNWLHNKTFICSLYLPTSCVFRRESQFFNQSENVSFPSLCLLLVLYQEYSTPPTFNGALLQSIYIGAMHSRIQLKIHKLFKTVEITKYSDSKRLVSYVLKENNVPKSFDCNYWTIRSKIQFAYRLRNNWFSWKNIQARRIFRHVFSIHCRAQSAFCLYKKNIKSSNP